jgi:hypothetical protein
MISINFGYRYYDFIPVLVIIFLLTSCSPFYYPNNINIPAFRNDSGTLNLSLSGSFDGILNPGPLLGGDLMLAYSPINHFAIMTNGSFGSNPDNTDSFNYHLHYFGEVGAGYYGKLKKSSEFEFYGGYGLGYSKTKGGDALYNIDNEFQSCANIKGNYQSFFLQADLGFKRKGFRNSPRVIEYGIGVRANYINFYKFEGTWYSVSPPNSHYSWDSSTTKPQDDITLQPMAFIRVGGKHVKIKFQGGMCLGFGANDYINKFFQLKLGIDLNLLKSK